MGRSHIPRERSPAYVSVLCVRVSNFPYIASSYGSLVLYSCVYMYEPMITRHLSYDIH